MDADRGFDLALNDIPRQAEVLDTADMGRRTDPAVRAAWQARTAMRGSATGRNVARPVAFFCSDESAFVTGQTLNVDGGIVLS